VLAFDEERKALIDPATGYGYEENAQFQFVPLHMSQRLLAPEPLAFWQALQEIKVRALAVNLGTVAEWTKLVNPCSLADEWLDAKQEDNKKAERLESILQLILSTERLTEHQTQRINMQWSNDVILNTATWNDPTAFVVKGLECLYHIIGVLQTEFINQRVETFVLPLYKTREAPAPSAAKYIRASLEGARLYRARWTRLSRWLERTLFTQEKPTLLSLTMLCNLTSRKAHMPEVFAHDQHRIPYLQAKLKALLQKLKRGKKQAFFLWMQHSIVTNKPFIAPLDIWKGEPCTIEARALAKQVAKLYHANKQLYGAALYLPLFRKAEQNGGSFGLKQKH
jgi:hypothetical protein